MRISSWTDDRIAELTRLWATGLSATGIAEALGGTTRNAVLGKVHRMDLPERAFRRLEPEELARRTEARMEQRRIRRRVGSGRGSARILAPHLASVPGTAVVEADPFLGALNISLMDLRDFSKYRPNQCRHMQAKDPAPAYLCCANETRTGSTYCAFHEKLCFAPQEKRRAVPSEGNRRGMKASNFIGSHEFA